MRPRTYTKKDVVEITAERLGYTCSETSKIVDGVFVTLREMLCEDKKNLRIEIRGFGSFAVKHRATREGRNPKTGETVHILAKRMPHFKIGKELYERINPTVPEQEIC